MSDYHRRAAILRLATSAYEMGLDVVQGEITMGADGRWLIGVNDLQTWLSRRQGEEVVLVLGALADNRPVTVMTCRTCGRDYTDTECPHCRANRRRFRGEP